MAAHINLRCRPRFEPARQAGFGLLEIMLALTVGLFLLGGVIAMYISSKQSYRETDAQGRMQENIRYAFHLMSRDVRMAGYAGCGGIWPTSMNYRSTLNLGSGAENSFAFDFRRGPIEGFEATSSTAWSSVSSGDPALSITATNIDANVLGGTDVISVRSADTLPIRITGQPNTNCDQGSAVDRSADLKVTANTLLDDDMIVMATNCNSATVFQITNFNSSQNVVHNTGTSSPGNSTKDLGDCFVNGEIVGLSAKSYYIRNNPAGVPSLYRKVGANAAEELVEGIENMQITYGIDTTNDSRADSYVAANSVTDWNRVVSARISLLARGIENNVVTAPQTYTYNGVTTTATDRRLHQVITSTITLRNRAY